MRLPPPPLDEQLAESPTATANAASWDNAIPEPGYVPPAVTMSCPVGEEFVWQIPLTAPTAPGVEWRIGRTGYRHLRFERCVGVSVHLVPIAPAGA